MKTRALALTAILCVLVCERNGALGGPPDLYVGGPYWLCRADPNTGANVPFGYCGLTFGLDFPYQDSTLYGVSSDLKVIDLATGHATTVGPLPELMVGITFSPTGDLYVLANGNDTIYRIDQATGASLGWVPVSGTVHSMTGSPFPGELSAIEFGPDGVLYGIGYGLYAINPVTGLTDRLTPLGEDVFPPGDPVDNGFSEAFCGLDFGVDGKLRAISRYSVTGPGPSLYEIDPHTGQAIRVGGMSSVEGFFPAGIASIPEPATLALLGLGALALLRRAASAATERDVDTA